MVHGLESSRSHGDTVYSSGRAVRSTGDLIHVTAALSLESPAMNTIVTEQKGWTNRLAGFGARLDGDRVVHFGDPPGELAAAKSGTVLCDLSHLGLIGASGADTDTFLQGQLSSDVRQLTATRAQPSSYNTPKGRVLATPLLFRNADGTFLQLAGELAASIRKRLSMFVLRAKVELVDATDRWVRIGVAGVDAASLVASNLGVQPATTLDVAHGDAATVIRLPGDRFEIVVAPALAGALWNRLRQGAVPVGATVWDWLEIRAGIATITPASQDEFVPQMLNLDLTGGVSFQKGCYPGQEIVARTQYLGKLKRRLYLAHVAAASAPTPTAPLFSADLEGQPSGTVVNAAPAPDGGFDLLAVIQISSAASQPVHVGSLEGPVLELLPLPYALPPAS